MLSSVRALLLVVSLSVMVGGCGGGGSSPGKTQLTANSAPVAHAGLPQNVAMGSSVILDGSRSMDPDGDALTYHWSFASKPVGSRAELSDPAVQKPVFVADVAGAYVVALTVNDGTLESPPAQVTVTTAAENRAPVADAGRNQSVSAGSIVTLDGSGSSDPDGNTLTYAWTLTAKPAGSAAVLSGASTAVPSFTADLPGNYQASLVVNDGIATSAPATISVDAFVSGENAVPVANPGKNMNVLSGTAVTLDGSGSTDENGDTLSYQWSFNSVPPGSTAVLLQSGTVHPSFTPDLPGTYVVALTVSDGKATGGAATVTVTAVSSINQLLTTIPVNNEVVVGGNVQTGATFTYTLKNNSNQAFQVTKAELLNGTMVTASTEDPALLNNGTLKQGDTIALTVVLSSTRPDNGFHFIYYLVDPISGRAFTIVHDFVPTTVTP